MDSTTNKNTLHDMLNCKDFLKLSSSDNDKYKKICDTLIDNNLKREFILNGVDLDIKYINVIKQRLEQI